MIVKKKYKLGWQVQPSFNIGLHDKYKPVLEAIKNFFGAGSISRHSPQLLQLLISDKKGLASVYFHFKKWKLITKKRADCELFMRVCEIIKRKEHLTPAGFRQILAIKASMNLGLS